MAINKVNVLGTVYDIGGGSGGGLTGYSGGSITYLSEEFDVNTECPIITCLKEDGTWTNTFSSTDKYVYVLLMKYAAGVISRTNCEIVGSFRNENKPYNDGGLSSSNLTAIIKPTADNWSINLTNVGGND